MIKETTSLLIAAAMAAGTLTAFAANPDATQEAAAAETAQEQELSVAGTGTEYGEYLYYEVNDEGTGVTITYCNTRVSGEFEIPSEIDGLPVTSIGERAFYRCENLTGVKIPDGVTSIGRYAFFDCTGLTSVAIPDGVTNIGRLAFYGCSGLTEISVGEENANYSSENGVLYNKGKTEIIQYPVGKTDTSFSIPSDVISIAGSAFRDCVNLTGVTIPDGVTSIGGHAFSDCTGLTSMTIPGSVTSIGNEAFYGCRGLTGIDVGEGNENYLSEDGVLYDKGKTEIIQYPAGKTDTSFEIPNSVTGIGNGAFYGCRMLESVTIPGSVTSVGDGAFYGCYNLENMTIPGSVTSIGDEVFYRCTGLENVTIQDGVTSIGDQALYYCSVLTSVTIPSSVTSIGDYVFDNCKILADVYYGGSKSQWEDLTTGVDLCMSEDAVIHYGGIVQTEPTVTVTDNGTSRTFDVTVTNPKENSYVYAAEYDANGAMLGIKRVELQTSGSASVTLDKSEGEAYVQMFVWVDETQQPITTLYTKNMDN